MNSESNDPNPSASCRSVIRSASPIMFREYIQKSTKKVLNTLEIAVSELVNQKQNLLTPDYILFTDEVTTCPEG